MKLKLIFICGLSNNVVTFIREPQHKILLIFFVSILRKLFVKNKLQLLINTYK